MAKEQDQSMEEILQSIKRIIAEEGEAPGGSDVLELTDLVQDDGSLSKAGATNNATGPAAPSPAAPAAEATAAPHLETMSIDEIIAAPVMPEFEPTPAKAAAPASPPPQPKPPEASMPKPTDESLVSEQTLSASAAALSALRDATPQPAAPAPSTPSPTFRSGLTVEDLVLETLRPMLKQWLDTNLTGIVERLVEREIRKLTAR